MTSFTEMAKAFAEKSESNKLKFEVTDNLVDDLVDGLNDNYELPAGKRQALEVLCDEINGNKEPTQPQSREEIKLNAKQQSAITMALQEKRCNIIGYAGTGKTTTVLEMVRQLIESGTISKNKHVSNHSHLTAHTFNFSMGAFTGLAVKTLRRVVPNEFKANCNTIHKIINFGPVSREIEHYDKKEQAYKTLNKKFFEPRCHNGVWINAEGYPCSEYDSGMTRKEQEAVKLDFDLVIIDEISMVGVKLLKMLLDALPEDCRIITIGDLAQLQPVLDSSIHPLLLAKYPTVELTQIYRQKEGDVISNANLIRSGKMPKVSDNFKILGIDKNENIAAQQVENFINKAYAEGRYDPEQDILLTPSNVGTLGQEMLNVRTRKIVNPDNDIMLIKTMRNQQKFAVGDRVINLKNDNEIGVYNGMLGWIDRINANAGISGEHYNNSNLGAGQGKTGEFEGLEFDVGKELEERRKEQKLKKQRDKVNAMFGGGLYKGDNNVIGDADVTDEGTGLRKASHFCEIQFDYLEEDDAGGLAHHHLFETSTQIENLALAYWITIHKSQGSGFRNVFICLHDCHGQMLFNELLYTAVTRCVENVTLLCTKYALKRCVNNMRIKGSTMDEKINSYISGFDMDKMKGIDL